MTESILNVHPAANDLSSFAATTKTTCPYCGVGCGVIVHREEDGSYSVKGDKEHPANLGRLCSKGTSLGETLALDDRLLVPKISGEEVSWDTALDTVADKFASVIKEHGPDAVALYVSGQILTEDYYVANKLMKGFVGTSNIDTNSRLCMATAVVGHKRAFGTDTVPACYEDLETTDLLVITGSNLAWAHPVLFQRVMAAKKARPEMKVVVVDPRRTSTCDIADLHLAIELGSDAALFNGLLAYLAKHDALDQDYIDSYTEGFDDALELVSRTELRETASYCGVSEEDLISFYEWFKDTPKSVTAFSQGINQSSSGVDKANAILNVHLATGRIGKPGASPFSITGQPNAMGGREVGGLANQLAAHMDFDEVSLDRVQSFWDAPNMVSGPGLKAVDLFNAVNDGKVKAIWIMSTNPVVSMPEADRVKMALEKCEFVVVSECIEKTDTAEMADVLLPAATWGEKDGTVTNSERRISHQKAFLTLPGQAKPDWWALTQVAQRLGFTESFDYQCAADIFREHAALSAFENHGTRDFDIGAKAEISDAQFAELEPFQWPMEKGEQKGLQRMFADGRFFTPTGKARFHAASPRKPASVPNDQYPLVLNTGRIRDQWHTMTRTAKTSRLMGHLPEPYLEIHADDAEAYGLEDQQLAEVYNHHGKLILRVKIVDTVRAGTIFVPMHWTAQYASAGRVDALVSAFTDPLSGQPESKHSTVAVKPYQPAWQGFILSRSELQSLPDGYWAKVREKECFRYVLADEATPENWKETVHQWLGDDGNWIELEDSKNGGYRAAKMQDGKLDALLVVSENDSAMTHNWLASQFAEDEITNDTRRALLSGRPAGPMKDIGRIICSCFTVGINTIVEAIKEQGLVDVDQIGAALKAGTNCGSCKPELAVILEGVQLGKTG